MVMRRFDVFRNPSPRSSRTIPYLVLVQSELLDELPTQVVVPLVKGAALGGRAAARLNPSFDIEGAAGFSRGGRRRRGAQPPLRAGR